MAIIGYNIYKNGVKQNVSLIEVTQYQANGVNGNTIYNDFTVTAVDDVLGESPIEEVPTTLTEPDQVLNLVPTVDSGTQITLNWEAVGGNGTVTYNIYRGTSAGNLSVIQLGNVGVSYVDENLTEETQYFYAVEAENATDKGQLSSEINATTDSNVVIPSNVALSNNSIAEENTVNQVVGNLSANGTSPITYSITGADASSFNINGNQLRASEIFDFEVKDSYSITITATNSEGSSSAIAFTITVTDINENTSPSLISAPTISGTTQVGDILTRTLGTYNGTPTPTRTGVWQRGTTTITNQTGATYTLVSADVGQTIRWRETATNSEGSLTTNSASTATITAAGTTASEINIVPINTVTNGSVNNPNGYVEYLPANYASRNDWPLYVHLGGGGETGNGSSASLTAQILNKQLFNRINNGLELPFIVVGPISTSAEFTNDLVPMMEWIITKYSGKFNTKQLHFSGISGTTAGGLEQWMGGNSASALMLNSIAFLSSNGLPVAGNALYVNIAARNIRTWFHHGTTDGAVSLTSRHFYFDRLLNEFGKIDTDIHRFTAYINRGHETWNFVYQEQGWGLAQSTGEIDAGFNIGQYYAYASPEKLFDWMLEEVPAKATITLSKPNVQANQILDITGDMTYEESFSWNFGDGSAVNTTDKNPSHTYTTTGTKTITLTVTNRFGADTIVTQELLVISDNLVEVQRAKLDFSSSNVRLDNTWNAVNGAAWLADTNPVLTNLANVSTGWNIRLLANAKVIFNSNNGSGVIDGNAGGAYPDSVVSSQSTFMTSTFGAVQFEILGLDSTKFYEFRFFGNSQNWGSVPRPSIFTIQGITDSVEDTRLNYIDEAVLVNVIPDVNGRVEISINGNGINTGTPAYMTAMQIIEREEA